MTTKSGETGEARKGHRRVRANGEGAIYKRPDGRWTARLTVSGGKRKDFYGKTREEVGRKLALALKDQADGLPVGLPDRLTLGQFLPRWLEDVVRPAVRYSTYASYEGQARLHIVPKLGNVALTKLTVPTLQSFYRTALESGLSARTVQYQHRVLRMAMQTAMKWGYVARNVVSLAEPPRVPRPSIKHFDQMQAREFLRAVAADRLNALYVIALCCGLRRGEVLALSWRDVDFEHGTIAIRRTFTKVPGGWMLSETKTASSNRVVRLPELALEALRHRKLEQLADEHTAGDSWRRGDPALIFTTSLGHHFDGDNLRREFQRHLKRAGLPNMPFHALRHSAATLMLALGFNRRL